jgi:hypothetical protein
MDRVVRTNWAGQYYAIGFSNGKITDDLIGVWQFVCSKIFTNFPFRVNKFYSYKDYILYPIPRNKYFKKIQERYIDKVCCDANELAVKFDQLGRVLFGGQLELDLYGKNLKTV